MFVCVCNAVTDREVEAAIDAGAQTPSEVTARCGAGGDCGSCHHMIEQMIEAKLDDGGLGVAPARSDSGPDLVSPDRLVRERAA
jgi:bacterioferritin-associated ferredoxin